MQKIKYIYILSQRYSGSTLLSFLLGTHPEIATIGERRKFYVHAIKPNKKKPRKCSCGENFQDCPHWTTIKDKLMARLSHSDFLTDPTEFQIFKNKYLNRIATNWMQYWMLGKSTTPIWPIQSKINELNRINRLLVQEILTAGSGNIFLDSSKTIDHIPFLSLIDQFDLHVVWLTRDPRAQVNSAMKYNKWTVDQATNYWKREMVKNQKILHGLGVKRMQLSYEELCRDPETSMIDILNFCGMDPSYSLDFRSKPQHIMGNFSMRMGKDNKIVERQEWKESLSTREVQRIEKLTREYKEYYSPH